MFKYYFTLVGFLIVFSCGKSADTPKSKVKVKKDSHAIQKLFNKKERFVFSETLTASVNDSLKSWKQYGKIATFLSKNYLDVSPAEALEMSNELAEISISFKDSVSVPILANNAMFARLNVFTSEVLRLKDMATIPNIKSKEVAEQTKKILAVFSAINSKINSLYKEQSFDSNLNFDESLIDFNEGMEALYSSPNDQYIMDENTGQPTYK